MLKLAVRAALVLFPACALAGATPIICQDSDNGLRYTSNTGACHLGERQIFDDEPPAPAAAPTVAVAHAVIGKDQREAPPPAPAAEKPKLAVASDDLQKAKGILAIAADLWKEGDLPAAELAFKRGLELAPNDGQGNFAYAKFLSERGDQDAAAEYFRRAAAVTDATPERFKAEAALLIIAGKRAPTAHPEQTPIPTKVDEATLATGPVPSFYACKKHSECQAGNVCVREAAAGQSYCKPICEMDSECTSWAMPHLQCLPQNRADGSLFPHHVCNAALSSLSAE
jgi:tetratricopeptide (TPR) repeat protein